MDDEVNRDGEVDSYFSGYDTPTSPGTNAGASLSSRGRGPHTNNTRAPGTFSNSQSADFDLMDTCDRLDSTGKIAWRHLGSNTSMKTLSNHLQIPSTNEFAALKALMRHPMIDTPVKELMANTKGNKNHWKPSTMAPSISQDRTGAQKYSSDNPRAENFSAYDWTCYTLEKVKMALCTEAGGPFYRKTREEDYLYARTWSLIKFMRWNLSESRIKKRTRDQPTDLQTPPAKRQRVEQISGTSNNNNNIQGIILSMAPRTTMTTGAASLIPAVDRAVTSLGDEISGGLLKMLHESLDGGPDLGDQAWEKDFVQKLVDDLRDEASDSHPGDTDL